MPDQDRNDLAERAARHEALQREALGRRPEGHTTASGRLRPWVIIAMASVGHLAGWLLVNAGSQDANVVLVLLGAVLAGVSGIYLAIGTIAEGIRLGAAWVAEDRPGHRRT